MTVISHASTVATRVAAFPGDEPIERPPNGGGLGRMDTAVRGPEKRCAQTATALGIGLELPAGIDERLRDCDYGRWRGRSLDDVAAAEPHDLTRWLTDPASAPHGGESIVDLLARVGGWLDAPRAGRRIAVITHPAVIKAMIVHVLRADPSAFWRIDIAPLSRTVLRGEPGRWTLRWLTADESAD
jgi:broad specificity phosphatase PhoE